MSDLVAGGVGLWRGQQWVARNPRWWRFGMIPALVAMVVMGALLGALVYWLGDLVDWATPFADHWSAGWRRAFRDLVSALVLGGGLLLSVVGFTALTLVIGQPFYERLVKQVTPPPPGAPEVGLLDSLVDGLRIGLRAAACAVGIFVVGCVPVLGQLLAPVLGLAVSGYFLTVELTSTAFELRGVPPRERLRGRRMLAVGFGAPLALVFLVPFATVLLMPGAVAGAALLVEELAPVQAAPVAEETPDQEPENDLTDSLESAG